jgi:hypothetical protein
VRLKTLLNNLALVGLVGSASLQCVYLLSSTGEPDAGTGRTEAVVFAPEISHAPSYITTPQAMALAFFGALSTVAFLLWIVMTIRARLDR